jgi:phage terminase small subunit
MYDVVKKAEGDAAAPRSDAAVTVGGTGSGAVDVALSDVAATRARCKAHHAKFAELYVLYRNKARAYRESVAGMKGGATEMSIYTAASQVSNRPEVRAYIRALETASAQRVVIDTAAILAHDMAVIEGYREIQDLVRYEHQACRHCYGRNHRYQWIDEDEFEEAYAKALDDAAILQKAPKELSDEGGYGYTPNLPPVPSCRKCHGHGEQRTVFADTRTLEGPAAAAYKGMKETKFGVEVLTHDIDKAKERLLRAAGAFGDDAASVARGAAAGAAAGSMAAAHALRERLGTMSGEEIRKRWIQEIGG